ncbi:MAG: peptidoglycan DD-metalloendopeptidase family protein [Gammaproteobacteria bacterium]
MAFGRMACRAVLRGALGIALAACAAPSLPPVINKDPHRVIPAAAVARPADSIYTLAWRHGMDYQDIVKWNGLAKPFDIRPGQRLRLRAPGAAKPAQKSAAKSAKTARPAKTTKAAKTAKPAKAKPPATRASGAPKQWRWPAKGKLIAKFSRGSGQNGIKIAGAAGSAIRATAAGEVVYAGDGLRGYGNLIIIEHSPSYLSAYAHNRKILVAEGARIKSGQQIAQMGDSGAARVMLHFEIRKSGKPVDPLRFLK